MKRIEMVPYLQISENRGGFDEVEETIYILFSDHLDHLISLYCFTDCLSLSIANTRTIIETAS